MSHSSSSSSSSSSGGGPQHVNKVKAHVERMKRDAQRRARRKGIRLLSRENQKVVDSPDYPANENE